MVKSTVLLVIHFVGLSIHYSRVSLVLLIIGLSKQRCADSPFLGLPIWWSGHCIVNPSFCRSIYLLVEVIVSLILLLVGPSKR